MTDYSELVKRLHEGTFGSDETKTDIVINAYMHNAADALEAQAKLIKKLEANAVFWQKDALHTLKVKNEGDARIAELEVALKPFIEELVAAEAEYDELDDDELVYVFKITYGDLRAARAALKGERE